MSFNSLSTELVLEVFLYVPPSVFPSLSRSCKRFHVLVEPQLYRTITQTRRNALQQLLRSLIIKPHRAKYIQQISAKAWEHQAVISTRFLDIDQSGPRVRPHSQIQELLPEKVFGRQHCEGWYKAVFTNRGWDAIFALLLIICTKLESANLRLCNDAKYPFIERVLKVAGKSQKRLGSQQYFTHLSQICLNPVTASQKSNLFSLFLKLDSVTEFNGKGAFRGWNRAFDLNSERYVFNIANVALTDNAVYSGKGQEFTQVLRSFYSMRTFSCEGSMGASCECEDWTIMNGLVNSKQSLEELTLSSLGERFRDRHSERSWSPITSFKGYTKLKSLELDFWMFLHATEFAISNHYTAPEWLSALLPRSLEHLSIRGCKFTDLDKLRTVFASARFLLGNLTTLKIVYQVSAEDFEPSSDGLWPALEEATRSHGIVLIREMHLK